jgi:adenylate kinase family enzyme
MDFAGLRKIVVYGPSGSGKSTITRELGLALDLPVIELDAVIHCRPNWNDLSPEEFRAAVTSILAEHPQGWIIDGNYSVVRDLILPNAEAAVWLRLPWRTVYPRLARRTIARSARHAPLWGGNYESWRQTLFSRESMLWWGIAAFRRQDRSTAAVLRAGTHSAQVFELHSASEVDAFVRAVREVVAARDPRPEPASARPL